LGIHAARRDRSDNDSNRLFVSGSKNFILSIKKSFTSMNLFARAYSQQMGQTNPQKPIVAHAVNKFLASR
jgi:hypothetical protein